MSRVHKPVDLFPELTDLSTATLLYAIQGGVDYNLPLSSLSGQYARTTGEAAASVTPTDYSYPPGNILRYGADPTGVADSAAAIQAAIDSVGRLRLNFHSDGTVSQSTAQRYGLVYLPGGTYLVNSTIDFRSFTFIMGAGRYNTLLDFRGAGAVNAFEPDRANGYAGVRTAGVHFRDFTMFGDHEKDQSGVSGHGFLFDDVSNSSIDRVEVRSFDDAIHLSVNTLGSYYNNFSINGAYNYRNLYIGSGCAVNRITGGVWAVRADHTNHADYQIYVEKNDLTIEYGSLEGSGNTLIAHVWSGDGDIFFTGRTEGAPLLSIPGNGFTGQCNLNFTGGPTSYSGSGGGYIILTDIEGINPDEGQTNFGSSIDLGFPSGTLVEDLIAGVRFGPLASSQNDGWSLVSPTDGYAKWQWDRADTFLTRGGVHLKKIDTGITYLGHTFTWRGANTFVVFLVKLSADAVIHCNISGLTGHSGSFKTAGHIIDYGNGWHLYVANISDYASTDLSANIQLGLKAASPNDSWITVGYVGVFTGGFPLFPSEQGQDFWLNEEPTEGVPQIRDRIWVKEPASGAVPGWMCVDRNDTTVATAAAASATKIYLTSTTGMAVGDKLGIDLDDETQDWTDIASVSSDGGGAFVTVNDALNDAAAIGNKVITFEMAAMAALA